ncbi:MAG: diacylglycerol/lipid kinase family protein [Gemmatimonadaceae bacterium]
MSLSDPARASAASPAFSRRIPAFVNPNSPSGRDARDALSHAGAFELVDLDGKSLRLRIQAAIDSGAQRVVVAGGDGTLGTAAAALLGSDVEMAVIAVGTLNHFAKDHGIPEDTSEAIGTALGGTSAPVDAGTVNDHTFLNTASVGLYVRYVRTRERLERFLGYRVASAAAFIAIFLQPRALSVELEVDGAKHSYRTPLLFVGVGERELKAPELGGRVAGGRRGLHVMIVRGRGPARLFTMAMVAAARGVEHASSSLDLDAFVVESCTVRVRGRRAMTIGLDGELMRVPAPLEFRLARDSLRVVGARRPADQPREGSV